MTGFNGAFVINSQTKEQLIHEDPKSAEIIRPILRGRDISRYDYAFEDSWLIATFPSLHIDINQYPKIKEYLQKFGIRKLEQTGKEYIENGVTIKARKKTNNKWFETQDTIAYWDNFSKQKIVWKRIGSKLRFALDNDGMMCLDSTCIATGDHIEYLTAVLNSVMGNYLLKNAPKTGTGDLIISVQAIDPIKVPVPTRELETAIINLLATIISERKQKKDFSEAEQQLDEIVFDLYCISQSEREFIKKYVFERYR